MSKKFGVRVIHRYALSTGKYGISLIFISGVTVQYICIYNFHDKLVKKKKVSSIILFSVQIENHLLIPDNTSFVEVIV
jgi:hypothetical protein